MTEAQRLAHNRRNLARLRQTEKLSEPSPEERAQLARMMKTDSEESPKPDTMPTELRQEFHKYGEV